MFGIEDTQIYHQGVKLHSYLLFVTVFPLSDLLYIFILILIISCIDCKIEVKTKIFAFAAFIFRGSSFTDNISDFEDFKLI